MWKSCVVPAVLACGCVFEAPAFSPQTPDALADAGTDGASGASVANHLLLTEIEDRNKNEFIEIYNPTSATVTLTDYYVTDCNEYWKLPDLIGNSGTLTISGDDFFARFPTGATLAPGGVATIASDGNEFANTYAINPTYTLSHGSNDSGSMLLATPNQAAPDDQVLTNSGEFVVLFRWDGASDLVQDVDIVVLGNAPSTGNSLIAKQAVDGPDADATTSSYAADAGLIGDFLADSTGQNTFKRLLRETGLEHRAVGGNGITGDDETSEMIRLTWEEALSPGTPGTVPASLQQ